MTCATFPRTAARTLYTATTTNHGAPTIRYRGSHPYQPLRATPQPVVASQVGEGSRRKRFNEAIHFHKYNKDYDALQATLGELASAVMEERVSTELDTLIVDSFISHCENPRYGGARDPELLQRAKKFASKSTFAGNLRDGPSWWQQMCYGFAENGRHRDGQDARGF